MAIPRPWRRCYAQCEYNASASELLLDRRPPLVLSHWDSDHWAGAQHDRHALTRTWVAPRQPLGPTHTAFANNILKNGGRLLIWPSGPTQPPITWQINPAQQLTIGRCSGSDRNGSGLAMRIDDRSSASLRHWLLTGDAGYHQLPFPLSGDVVAAAVPHHGATMPEARSVPGRPSSAYARLVFSFGPGNQHGSQPVGHPTSYAVQTHEDNGWDVGTWSGQATPGDTVAGGDVLATAKHTSSHLGGCIAGWTSAPTPIRRPCRGVGCTTELLQS